MSANAPLGGKGWTCYRISWQEPIAVIVGAEDRDRKRGLELGDEGFDARLVLDPFKCVHRCSCNPRYLLFLV